MIGARIDRLPAGAKIVLQRGSVIGRTFWAGAIDHLSPEYDADELEDLLDDLLLRDLVTREERSTIGGEAAYRFKHVLIREVAYGGLSKSGRAEYHTRFAEWLREKADKEVIEIRAYHLDQACLLYAELDGHPPEELARTAAKALAAAGKRALALESNLSARKLLLRSVELESTLGRRFLAARAAWQLGDLPVVRDEMTVLVEQAAAEGDRAIQSRALTALSEVAASLDGELVRAAELADEALAVVEADDHDGRFRALDRRARVARWAGREAEAEEYLQQALEAARAAARKDHEARAALQLAGIYVSRMEEDKAEPLIDRALALAEESGSIVARASAAQSKGGLHRVRRQYEEAEGWLTKALDLYRETASVPGDRLDVQATRPGRLGDGQSGKSREALSRVDPSARADEGARHAVREPAPARAATPRRGTGRRGREVRARRARDGERGGCPVTSDDARRARTGACGAGTRRRGGDPLR